jgi:hypothetical protein
LITAAAGDEKELLRSDVLLRGDVLGLVLGLVLFFFFFFFFFFFVSLDKESLLSTLNIVCSLSKICVRNLNEMVYFLQNLDMPFGGFLVKTYCSRHSTMFSFSSLQLLTSRLSFNTVEEEDKVDGEERGVVAVVGLVGVVIKVGLVDGFNEYATDTNEYVHCCSNESIYQSNFND